MRVHISAGALLLFAALILMLPLQWVGAVLLAMLVHELCHAVMILLVGGNIHSLYIGSRGMVLEADSLSGVKESICALAGPVGSLLLLLFVRHLPRTAVCGAIHGIFNLLPLFPLDGGRVLLGLLQTLLSPLAAKSIFVWIQRIALGGLLLLTAILVIKIGILPLLAVILLLVRAWRENPLAKKPFWR